MILLLSSTLQAGSQKSAAYKYTDKDGSVLFTDIKVNKRQLANGEVSIEEVASGQAGRRSYQGSYGRPQATASCKNLTSGQLAGRAAKISPYIERFANEHSLDKHLVKAIARIESCFDPYAKSTAGARGLMQLMPATAAQFGVTELYDIEKNIATGVRYFAELTQRYQHNTKLALAAYNAGPTAVDKYKGIPPYPETQSYVKKVLRKYREYAGLKPKQ